MKTSFETRERKRRWAVNHPQAVREANRRWRLGREIRLAAQAKIRMQRMRARRKAGRAATVVPA